MTELKFTHDGQGPCIHVIMAGIVCAVIRGSPRGIRIQTARSRDVKFDENQSPPVIYIALEPGPYCAPLGIPRRRF
jgi:hypothetical protein